MRYSVLVILAGTLTPGMLASPAAAQVSQIASRGPRFIYASSRQVTPITDTAVASDASDAAVLRRRLSISVRDVSIGDALREIAQRGKLQLLYSSVVLPVGRRVSLQAKQITVAAALTEVLFDTGIDVVLTRSGQMTLVQRRPGRLAAVGVGRLMGRVTDAKTGQAVASAEVFLEKTKWQAKTDTNGRYIIDSVEAGDYKLIVRRFGYVKQSLPVTVMEGRTDTVHVTVTPTVTHLQEVLTTATGSSRRLEMGNDITTLNADSLVREAPIHNVTQLLEGRVPGLTVQHTSGAPGDPSRLRLRGAGSPTLNIDPIVVVDGIRMYAQQSAARNRNLSQATDTASSTGYGVYATPSPLDNIDPNIIDKIEVLKGSSAAALYGADAANGVIVITTKRGKAGPTRWSLLADYRRARIPGLFPDLVGQWGHSIAHSPSTILCPLDARFVSSNGFVSSCVGDSVSAHQLLNSPSLSPLAASANANMSLTASGGSSTLTYSVTGSYLGETGMPKLPDYEATRFQARVGTPPPDWMLRPQHLTQWSVTSTVTARLGSKADLTLGSTLSRALQQRSSLEQQMGVLQGTYYNPSSGTYYTVGSGVCAGGQCYNTFNANNDSIAPFLGNYYQKANSKETGFRNNVRADWRLNQSFSLSGQAGLDYQQRNDQTLTPYGFAPGADSAGSFNIAPSSVVTTTIGLQANVARFRLLPGVHAKLGMAVNYFGTYTQDQSLQTSHLVPGTASPGAEILGTYWREVDISNFNWSVEPGFQLLGFWLTSSLQLQNVGNTYGNQARSFLSNLREQLKFPPTFSTSYMISDAPFFPFKDLFQTLRLRTAFGRAGRQPGPAERYRLYNAATSQWVQGNFAPTVYLTSLGNTELRPERSTELEGGFDAEMFGNALSVGVTAYRQTTTDMILPVPYPLSVYGGVAGRGSVSKNIGDLRTTGLELDAAVRLLQGGPVNFSTRVIMSQKRNVLLSLAPGVQPFYSGGAVPDAAGIGGYSSDVAIGTRVAPGYPLFGRWARVPIGYADANGNGVLEGAEIVWGDTAVYVGSTTPNYTASIQPNLGFFNRAISVSADFLYDNGLSQWNRVGVAPFTAANFVPGTPIADQFSIKGWGGIQDVYAFRLNALSINYRLSKQLTERLGAQDVIVGVQGTNLGLWSNYRGIDPNVNAFVTGNNVADNGVIPQSRTWQVRVSATF